MLTGAQRQPFVQDGYLVVRDAFGPERTADLQRWTAEVLAAPEVPGRHAVSRELNLLDPSVQRVARVENLCSFHAELDAPLFVTAAGAAATARAGWAGRPDGRALQLPLRQPEHLSR